MLRAIRHGLGNLLNFQGRDARQTFWFYVLFLYLLSMGISMAVSIPMSIQATMIGVKQGIAHANQGDAQASEAAMQAAISGSMSEMMPLVIWVGFAGALIILLGLAASIVRRLHDSDLSGYWALFPLGLKAFSVAMLPAQMGKIDQMIAAQSNPMLLLDIYDGLTGLGAIAGWVAFLLVIGLGLRKSTPGPNRFGDAPFIA